MKFFTKTYQVNSNTTGFLFRAHQFEKQLEAGYHEISDFKNQTFLICLPNVTKTVTILNQEILTRDQIALRFSYTILYRISDGEKFLRNFTLDKTVPNLLIEAEQRLVNHIQPFVKNRIAELNSEQLNEHRTELNNLKVAEMEIQPEALGITVETVQLRDITFPKAIQDLFAKHLEAKIRAKTDLENARTTVATARALKNASELMKGDENIRFFQMLETISKIAQKGKHTFAFGELQNLGKSK